MASIFMVRDNLDNIPQYDLPVGCNIHTLRPGEEKLWEWVCEGAFANDFGSDFKFDFDRMMRSSECFSPERVFLGQQYAQVTTTASAWHDPQVRRAYRRTALGGHPSHCVGRWLGASCNRGGAERHARHGLHPRDTHHAGIPTARD